LSLRRGDRDREGLLQPGRLRGRQRGAAGDGRHGLQRRDAGGLLPAALPRLDDRRRLDRDPQEPHRRRHLREELRAAAREGMSAKALTRWHAAGLHFLICVAIATAVVLLMLELWYPRPLFEAAGGNDLLFIIVGVDVILGPLLTLVVFKAGKWGMKFD